MKKSTIKNLVGEINRTGIVITKERHIDQDVPPCPLHMSYNEHCLECFEHRAFIIEDIKRDQLRKINPIRFQWGITGMIANA